MSTPPPLEHNPGTVRARRARVAGWWTGFSVCVVVVLICGGIIVGGMVKSGDGEALIDDPGAVLVGFMALLGAGVSFVAPKLETIRHQVQNSHKVNLRDDLDDKFAEVLKNVADIADDVHEVRLDVGGMKQDLRQIRSDAGRLDERVNRLQDAVVARWQGKTNTDAILAIEDTVDRRKEVKNERKSPWSDPQRGDQ